MWIQRQTIDAIKQFFSWLGKIVLIKSSRTPRRLYYPKPCNFIMRHNLSLSFVHSHARRRTNSYSKKSQSSLGRHHAHSGTNQVHLDAWNVSGHANCTLILLVHHLRWIRKAKISLTQTSKCNETKRSHSEIQIKDSFA